MTTELAPYQPQQHGLVPSNLSEAMRLAEVMCKGQLVPKHLQSSPADCLLVIEQAVRWGFSPFAVAQCTSVIQGKLMYEGKLVMAVINTRGELEKRLSFSYADEGDNRTVTVAGLLKGEDERRTVDVRLKDVRTTNRVWQTQPDQQLAYAGARVWARRHMPELMLGVYDPVEFDEPRGNGQSATVVAATEYAPGVNHNGSFAVEAEEVVEAEGLEMVDMYNVDTGEVIGRQPKLSDGQSRKLHALRNELRNVMDDDKFRKRLVRTFGKDTSTALSISEASRLIDALERMAKKQSDRAVQALAEVGEMLAEKREPGHD